MIISYSGIVGMSERDPGRDVGKLAKKVECSTLGKLSRFYSVSFTLVLKASDFKPRTYAQHMGGSCLFPSLSTGAGAYCSRLAGESCNASVDRRLALGTLVPV